MRFQVHYYAQLTYDRFELFAVLKSESFVLVGIAQSVNVLFIAFAEKMIDPKRNGVSRTSHELILERCKR